MKWKRITALLLVATIVMTQESAYHLTVQAEGSNSAVEVLAEEDTAGDPETTEEGSGKAGEAEQTGEPAETGEAGQTGEPEEPKEAEQTGETSETGQTGEQEETSEAGQTGEPEEPEEAQQDGKPEESKQSGKVSAAKTGESEEVAASEDEEAYTAAKEAFAELIADHDIYALLNQCESYDVLEAPSYESGAVVNLLVGHQVRLTGVEFADGLIWYQVEAMAGGIAYTGYIAKDYLVSADEGLEEWQEAVSSMLAGAAAVSDGNAAAYSVSAAKANKTDVSAFPASYQPYIRALIASHPNWTFVPMNTGLDWSTVIKNEMSPARNLVPLSSMDTWKESDTVLSAPYWVQASESIVRYYMDPRNFLNDTSVFQFEMLAYNSSSHTESGVKTILKNTFMSDKVVEGTSLTYAKAFMQIGKELNISPYHLASRVRQEQGTAGTSKLISGTYPGYEGLYNYFNIQASGATETEIIVNGLKEARAAGWTSRYAALYGGSKKVATNYISIGQNTLYLQKFDVDKSDGNLYWHQYMQNLLAADNEGKSVKRGYEEMGVLNNSFVFRVPVYNNMPTAACPMPTDTLSTPTLKASVSGYSKVTLSWSEVSGAQGYYIYRSTSSSSGYSKIASISSVGTTTWSETLTPGKTYYYKVKAYKTFNGVTSTSTSSAKKATTKIASPEWGALKSSSYYKMAVTWQKVSGVTGYQVYRKTDKSGSYEKIATVKGSTTLSYTDTKAVPGHTYYYKVRGYKTINGKNYYSSFNTEKGKSVKIPAPTLKSVSLSSYTKATVKWEKVSGVTGYRIYRKTGLKGSYQHIGTVKGSGTLSYTDKTAQPNNTYYYKIRGYKTVSGKNYYSSYSGEKSRSTKMATPTLVSAALAGTNKITLSWEGEKWIDGYRIYRADSVNGSYKAIKNVSEKSSKYTDTSLEANGTYYYKIRTYVTVNGSKKYSPYSNVILGKTKLTTPTVKSISTASATSAKLTWKKTESATGYQIYQATSYSGKYTRVKTITKNTTVSYTKTSLTPNKTYYYKIRAYSKVNNSVKYSKFSAITSITPRLEEPEIQSITGTTTTRAKITWKEAEDAQGYRLYRSDKPGSGYKLVKDLGGTAYTDNSLKKGKTYYYKVRAYVKVDGTRKYSGYSDVWSVQTKK